VIKVPDGLAKQVAFQGFFCPTPVTTTTGCASISPYLSDSAVLQLSVFTGDLGLDKGVAVNAYSLNEVQAHQDRRIPNRRARSRPQGR
jgi:hypothetical protein